MLHRSLKPQTKTRRNLLTQKIEEKRITNLKERHQLLLEDTDDYLNKLVHKSSATQMDCKNKEREESMRSQCRNRDGNKDRKDNPVNFYINIDKLKNLKISSRDSRKIYMSQHSIKEQNVQNTRKSLMLRNFAKDRKGAIRLSYEQNNKSLSKIYGDSSLSKHHLDTTNNKSSHKDKSRYQTALDEKDEANETIRSSSYNTVNKRILPKRNNYKRESELKDKNFIDGYLRGKQLGRGGFSKVWEAFNFKSKSFYAVKEIDTQNKYQTHLTEIWFGNHFFENGMPKQEYINHPGIKNLLTMFTYSIVDPRAFIVYETCDGSLGNMLYDIYEEEGKDEEEEDNRLYMIKYKKLYGEMRKSSKFLKCLIFEIAQALNLLIENKIVHSDIKTENILLKTEERGIKFKLIDYGSSFKFESLKQYKLATPEYMCPELLNFILFENKKEHHASMLEYVKDYHNISGIDVWGLGCIILELIHGLPLWLTNPTKILIEGKYETKKGLFAVSDRSFAKILERQLYVVENLDHFLVKNNNSGILIDENIKKVLKGMLNPNPLQRIRPLEIINQIQEN